MTVVAEPPRARPGLRLAIALAFLLLFLWELLGAVSNLLAWAGFAAVLHRQLSAFAWLVLGGGVVVPIAAFVLAVLLTRRRTSGTLALVLVVAYAASQALTLSLLAFFQVGIGVR
ncbi:hypothetical protein [Amnibacterium sp.]|uniref:hypothetical protein n=1 Tax=Amnibacterium sp. TaxID=1872496 RepID=UPI00261FB87D|nr:hypothetical protein [Amnibacterium sp.]MCU1473067.1 hypothetical protein [Amnibacterium sp.]